jgi:hypothetical protein
MPVVDPVQNNAVQRKRVALRRYFNEYVPPLRGIFDERTFDLAFRRERQRRNLALLRPEHRGSPHEVLGLTASCQRFLLITATTYGR